MSQKLFIWSVISKRESDGHAFIEALHGTLEAVSHAEAMGLMMNEAEHRYPSRDGWFRCAPMATQITSESTLRVASENYAELMAKEGS